MCLFSGVGTYVNTVGTSTLLGKRLTFVGFCFNDHPIDPNLKIQLSVYRFVDRGAHVLCLSETEDPDVEGAKQGLGAEVHGVDIAPFAARLIDEPSTKTLGKILAEAYSEAKFYWHAV